MCKRILQIYLAGPITGCAYKGATDWREYVTKELDGEFVCLSPMRSKAYLEGEKDIAKSYDANDNADSELPEIGKILSCNKGINRRDSWDCRTADIILMNLECLPVNFEASESQSALLNASRRLGDDYYTNVSRRLKRLERRISIGTMLELGMAWMSRRPVIAVMKDKNVHCHPMVDDMIDFKCDDLEQALQVVRALR